MGVEVDTDRASLDLRPSPCARGGPLEHRRLAPVYEGLGQAGEAGGNVAVVSSYIGDGLSIPLPRKTTQDTVGLDRTGLQQSLLFLLFFRKEGVRNFFFFLEGDLPGDPSLPGSAAAPSSGVGEEASSAPGTGAGSGLATVEDLAGLGGPRASPGPSSSSLSSVGKPSASEGSSGDRSGRVGLEVAASPSSPEAGSRGRSGGQGRRDRVRAVAQPSEGSLRWPSPWKTPEPSSKTRERDSESGCSTLRLDGASRTTHRLGLGEGPAPSHGGLLTLAALVPGPQPPRQRGQGELGRHQCSTCCPEPLRRGLL